MEIEEADSVVATDNVIETRLVLGSASSSHKHSKRAADGSSDQFITTGTQTLGHVFLGKQREVIITTNYTLVNLVINNEAIDRFQADFRSGVNPFTDTDTILASLARLDWNGERLLEKAMTSFRLNMTRIYMPKLVEELTDILKTEAECHRVQHVVQRLFEKHAVKLFGVDVGSLSFILEHSSVDDAYRTLTSTARQDVLKQILLSLLPDWAAQVMTSLRRVTSYALTSEDLEPGFGFRHFTSVSFVADFHHKQQKPTCRPVGRYPDMEPSLQSSSQHGGAARATEEVSASAGRPEMEAPKPSTGYGFPALAGEGSETEAEERQTGERSEESAPEGVSTVEAASGSAEYFSTVEEAREWAEAVARADRLGRKRAMRSRKVCRVM